MSLKRFLKINAVCTARDSSRTQIYCDIRAGILPPPIRRSRNVNVWLEWEVGVVHAAEAAGASHDELRLLVARLVRQRQTAFRETLQEIGGELTAA